MTSPEEKPVLTKCLILERLIPCIFTRNGRQSNHGMCEDIKLSYSFNIWPECCVLRVQVAEGGLSGRRVTEPRYHCGVRFLEARDRWFKSVIWKYNVVFCETDILWRYEWQRKNANKLNEWKRKIYSFERCHQQPKPRRGQPGDSRVILMAFMTDWPSCRDQAPRSLGIFRCIGEPHEYLFVEGHAWPS